MNDNKLALDRIYNNIQAGKMYGEYRLNVKYPFFGEALYKIDSEFIGYTHYGSSATKNTKEWLNWIIAAIFKTTPEEFEKMYVVYDPSNKWSI